MSKPIQRLALAVLLTLSSVLYAAVDVYEFSSPDKRERFQYLVAELRCPKCQNQNLAGSDSPIATDLRRELYRQLEAGKSDEEIKAFMVGRYGDYVLYRPPVQENTLLLWWGPPAVLGLGLLIVLVLVWRRQRLLQKSVSSELSAGDQARLDKLLAQEQGSADANESKVDGDR